MMVFANVMDVFAFLFLLVAVWLLSKGFKERVRVYVVYIPAVSALPRCLQRQEYEEDEGFWQPPRPSEQERRYDRDRSMAV